MDRSKTAQRLQKAREAAGLSRTQAARLMNLHHQRILDAETGDWNPSNREIHTFANLYEVSVEWLKGNRPDIDESKINDIICDIKKLSPDDQIKLKELLTMIAE